MTSLSQFPIEATGEVYTEIAQAAYRWACLGEATDWHFRIEEGFVFARNGTEQEYLIDGAAAMLVAEKLAA